MAKVQTEADRLQQAVDKDSPQWRAMQAEAMQKSGVHAGKCHPWIPAVTVGIWLVDEGNKKFVRFHGQDVKLYRNPVKIGLSWICTYSEWAKGGSVYCHRIAGYPAGMGKEYTARWFRSVKPLQDMTELWAEMKQIGPLFLTDFGFFCHRDEDGTIAAYRHPEHVHRALPDPVQLGFEGKVPSHGHARIHAMAGDAYVQEKDEDYGDAQEPTEDVPF